MAVTAEQFAWMDRAACLGLPAEIFYPKSRKGEAAPLALCAECPVLAECRANVLRNDRLLRATDIVGIEGGMTSKQRRAIALAARNGSRVRSVA